MNNIMAKKCKKCNRNDCKLGYVMVTVKFITDKDDNIVCKITREKVTSEFLSNRFKDTFNPDRLYYYRMGDIITRRIYEDKNSFILVTIQSYGNNGSIKIYECYHHFYKWINNNITHGRFNPPDYYINGYVPCNPNDAKRYIKVYEEYTKYKIAFLKALANIK